MDHFARPLPPPTGTATEVPLPEPESDPWEEFNAPTLPPPAPTRAPAPATAPHGSESASDDSFWAPGPPAAPPARPVERPPVVDLETESTSPSKRPLMLIVAVVCLVALGLGAFFVFGGEDGAPSDEAAAIREVTDSEGDSTAYSFATATATVDAAPAMSMSMVMQAPDAQVDMSAMLDRRERRMALELTGTVSGLAVGDFRMIADEPAAMIYMSGAIFETDFPWISIDATTFGDMAGASTWFENPADITDLFVGTTPTDKGVESVDGEQMKRFEVTVSIAEMLALDPTSLDAFGDADLSQLEAITYDVWVDDASRLRRIAFDADALGETVSLDMRLDHIDEPIAIELPAPGDVMSLEEFMTSGYDD